MNRSVFRKMWFAVIAAVLLSASAAVAQDAEKMPKREMFVVTTLEVKSGMGPQFEEMMKTKITPAFKKGGAASVSVWQTRFGNTMEYHVVAPLPNFAALDGPSPVIRGLGDEAQSVFEKISPMIKAVTSKIYVERPDLSHFGQMEGAPNVAVLIQININGEKEKEFESFVKNEYMAAMKKTTAPGVWTSKVAFGGDADEYVMVEPHKNFAALDKGPPIAQVMSPAEIEAMFKKIPSGAVEDVRVTLMSYKPDLSYSAEQP